MRNLAPLMLAGLAAVTLAAMPASALCADDGNGGCSALRHDLRVDIRDDCADSAGGLCLASPEGQDTSFIPSGGILNLTVKNSLQVPVDFEVFVTGRFDDAQADDGSAARVRADRILLLSLQPGESVARELAVDGNASSLRLQAQSADGRHAEQDAEVTPIMAMTGMPEVDPAADSGSDAGASSAPVLDSESSGKDAPYLGVVAVVGVLAAIVGLRRFD